MVCEAFGTPLLTKREGVDVSFTKLNAAAPAINIPLKISVLTIFIFVVDLRSKSSTLVYVHFNCLFFSMAVVEPLFICFVDI